MNAAFSSLNIALADLPPVGGSMGRIAFGKHAGRKVWLQNVRDSNGNEYTRAIVDGVKLHYPSHELTDDEIVKLACDTVPRADVAVDHE